MMKKIVCFLILAIVGVQSLSIANIEEDEADNFSMDRIKNGLRANQNEYSFYVSITATSSVDQRLYLCSGTSISRLHVLTAATCTMRQQRYDLRFGSVTFYTGGFTLTSFTSFQHPRFNPITRQFDAALILLPRSIAQNVNTWRPIHLPPVQQVNSNASFANLVGRVTGYGLIGNHPSPVLQFENLRIIPKTDDDCQGSLAANNMTRYQGRLLCGSRVHHTKQTENCAGDTGSPLFILDTNRIIQVGIALYDTTNERCTNSTTLFTRIVDVAAWIRVFVPSA